MKARKSPHAVQVRAPIRDARAGRGPHGLALADASHRHTPHAVQRSSYAAHASAHRAAHPSSCRAVHPSAHRSAHRLVGLLTSCAFVATAVLACANTDANQVTSPVVLGMTNTAAPYYSDGNTTIYEEQQPVTLPMRRPTDDESKLLGKADPYPHAPFLLASDVRIEVRYTLSNLDDQAHNVELLLDPWNEFVRYRPGVQVADDETTVPNLSGYDRLLAVPAKSRVQGTITPDDMNELAVDLATAQAIMKNPPPEDNGGMPVVDVINHVFNLQNRSNDGDPLITSYIPKTIAGVTGFDLGIRTYETATVAVEIVVDITDVNGNRVIPTGSGDKPFGPPGTLLSPPGGGGGMGG
jgi:hypothetical protein